MRRLMIFIDAEYVVPKIKEICGSRKKSIHRNDIQWANIIRWITGNRLLVRCYYYSAEFSKQFDAKTYQEQHEDLRRLKLSIPYFDIKLGRLVHQGKNWVQKGIDVKIALDMYAKAVRNQYDTAALISGDSDFAEVITEVKERYGKHVELYTFDKSIYEALRVAPDKHIVISPIAARKAKFFNE